MVRLEPNDLLVWAIRRTLGISLGLYAFYLAAPYLWPIPPLTARDVLAILAVVFAGVWLGIGFSTVWPLPRERGLPRMVRTAILTIPALGIGIAIYATLEGTEGSRAFYVIFALGAWLGSTYLTADDLEEEGDVEDEREPEPDREPETDASSADA